MKPTARIEYHGIRPAMRLMALAAATFFTCLGYPHAGAALASQQGQVHPVFNNFLPVDQYVLEINGAPSNRAQILLAERLPGFLVLAPELTSAVILMPRTGMAQSVSTDAVVPQPDGSYALAPDAELSVEGRFLVSGREVSFSVAGAAIVLKEKPYLLGLQTVSALEDHSSGYLQREQEYSPYSSVLAELKSFPKDVRVRVYFGTWCAYCAQFVPRMMRVAREITGSRIQIEFYGLPNPAAQDPIVNGLGIEGVPTGIIYIDDEEVGRIRGNMWQSPETALKVLLEDHR